MVLKKNNENINGVKRRKTKKLWKWPDTKDPYSKLSGKDNFNSFGQSWWTRKSKYILSEGICGTKSRVRQRTKYTDTETV